MITVGVRELKTHLSHYLRLMQEGEAIAIQMRDKVIGYLSNVQQARQEKSAKRQSHRDFKKLIEQWKKEGFVISGGGKYRPCKAVKMTPGISASEIVRKLRDEEL